MPLRTRKRIAGKRALAIVMLAATSACGATIDWTNTSGGNFNDPTNWNSAAGPVPTVGDTAQFNTAGTFITTFDANPTNDALLVQQGAISFRPDTIASRTYTLSSATLSGGSLTLAAPASGTKALTLAMNGGTFSIENAQLIVNAGNDISNLGNMTLGTMSPGSISVATSGTTFVQTPNSGLVVGAASGTSSTFANNGTFTTGTGGLTVNPTGIVSGFGRVVAKGNVLLNGGSCSSEITLVAGTNLIAQNNAQFSGSVDFAAGPTAISILSGADLTTGSLNVGWDYDGALTVDGVGSTVTTTTYSSMCGDWGNAPIIISNSAVATFKGLTIFSHGSVTVESGATFNLTGGLDSSATITVTGAGTTCTQSVSSGVRLNGFATLHIDNGAVFTTGSSSVTNVGGLASIVVNGGLFKPNGDMKIGTFSGGGSVGTVTVTGTNSTVLQTQTAARTLTLGEVNTSGTSLGVINVNNGGVFTSGKGAITLNPGSTIDVNGGAFNANGNVVSTGNINVQGASSSFLQNGATTFSIGSGTGSAAVNIGTSSGDASTIVSSGTGTITVNTTGQINIGGSAATQVGTFNSNGTLTSSGGTINITRGTLNAGADVSLSGGLFVRAAAGTFSLAAGKNFTAQSNAQVTFNGGFAVVGGDNFTIQSGADLISASGFDIDNGTLIADGSGSTISAATSSGLFNTWGNAGGNAAVTIRNSASATMNELRLADSATAGTTGTLNVQSGGFLSVGTLKIAANGGATTSGSVTLNGSNSLITQGAGSNLVIGNSATGSATLTVNGIATYNVGSGGTVTVNSSGLLNVSGAFFNAAGNVVVNNVPGSSGSQGKILLSAPGGSFTQTGATTLTLGASSGAAGTLQLDAGTFSTGTGGTTLNSTGVLNVNGGTFNANGAFTSGGALTIASGTFNATTHLFFDGGSFTRSGGTFNLPAGKNLTAQNNAQLNFTGGFTVPNGSAITIQSGADWLLTSSIGLATAVLSGGTGSLLVDGVGSSVTVATAGLSATLALNGGNASATFQNGASGSFGEFRVANSTNAATVGLARVESDADLTLGNLLISTSGGASGTMIVTGAGSSVAQSGSSALTVGNSSGSATLRVENGAAFTTGTGAVTFNPSATLNIDNGTFTSLNFVRINSGATMNVVNNGKIDVTDKGMIIGGMSYGAVESLVKAGFGNFDWLGTGITSSIAATFAQDDGSRAVGVIDNADWGHANFGGQTVNSTDILVKFTYVADANLDGLVDNDDFGQFLYGFNGGGSARWLNGDFDYSGFVDNDDFGWFLTGLSAFNASGNMQLSDSFKAELAAFASEQGIPFTAVPEPASIGLIPIGILAARRARRRLKESS